MVTNKKDDALRLALEALVAAYQGKDKTGQVTEAITAIREALADQPAQRQPWVGLKDEDDVVGMARDAFAARYCALPVPESRIKALAEAIEAKLKEKNA